MKGLAGKRVIVTGAARGIGKSIATRFASEDCHVLIADLKADALAETTADLREIGRVESVTGDVASPEFCELLVREAEQRLGGVDVVVNNAGIVAFEPFLERTAVEWERTLALNLTAVFL